MPAKSAAMSNFRANVRRIMDATPGLGINALTARMNEAREQENRRRIRRGEKPFPMVSRPFISNLMLGNYDCSMTFAEEVAEALGTPLTTLLQPAEIFSEIWAQPA